MQLLSTRSMKRDADQIRRQTDKILGSPSFSGSERMSRFLEFVVEKVLAGGGSELKEYLLGVEVFDRGLHFDPRADPIVRVEARRLRAKLKQYYETEGREDHWIIELPTGAYVPRFHSRESSSCVRISAQPKETRANGDIVVLPFTNLSPEPDTDYFSDGLTEELIHALTRVEGLRVVAWHSAEQMKDRENDIVEIGRQLKVSCVLAGSVRAAGGQLRILARLIDTSTGFYLWSETYEREIADVFSIQEEIARAIVGTLRMRLRNPAAAHSPASMDAYNLYLKARFHWNKRTRDGISRSIDLLKEAIAIEPDLARAHAGLADAHALMAGQGLASPDAVLSSARGAAVRALELDPDLGEAHAAFARVVSLQDWNWSLAEKHYRRALELSPAYVCAHQWYACNLLALHGRLKEAIAHADIACRLDPLSCLMHEMRGYLLMLDERYADSMESYRQAAELDPYFYRAYTGCGRTLMQMGRYADAIEMIEKGRALAGHPPVTLGLLGQAHALAGNRQAAVDLLSHLSTLSRSTHVPASAFAVIHAGLGEPAKAIEWLERGCDAHEPSVAVIGVHPAYDSLRNQPRFSALLRRIGLLKSLSAAAS